MQSDGIAYGVPPGLWFSFPCVRTEAPGSYEIFDGIELSPDSLQKMQLTITELVNEKTDAEASLAGL